MKIKEFSKKQLALIVSLILILTVAVGGTLAYIVTQTGNVTNTFEPAEVTCAVKEDFANNVKSNVKIKNTGDAEAYIRAAVIISWKDAKGNVSAEVPDPLKGDYTADYNKTDWLPGTDGYFYYKYPVAAGSITNNLINSCAPAKNGPEGYTLHVEIIADAIQSKPIDAVNYAWSSIESFDANGTIAKVK